MAAPAVVTRPARPRRRVREWLRRYLPAEATGLLTAPPGPHRRSPAGSAATRTVRDLAIGFGPAEVLDTVPVRPAMIYAGQIFTGRFLLGTLLGKVSVDAVFYALAIVGYELRKRIFGVAATEGRPDRAS
jgi:hypothetical protein